LLLKNTSLTCKISNLAEKIAASKSNSRFSKTTSAWDRQWQIYRNSSRRILNVEERLINNAFAFISVL